MNGNPRFYRCGICDAYHALTWNGDCRQDDARFNAEDLDHQFGAFGWDEVAMPGGEEDV